MTAAGTGGAIPDENQSLFDDVVRGPNAIAVQEMVAREIAEALSAEGYVLEEWAPQPADDQTADVRAVHLAAPFEDPSSGVRFTATVRLFVYRRVGLHSVSVWVDMCRDGETRRDLDSVCCSVLDARWMGHSHQQAAHACERQLGKWLIPGTELGRTTSARELAADLTTILAP